MPSGDADQALLRAKIALQERLERRLKHEREEVRALHAAMDAKREEVHKTEAELRQVNMQVERLEDARDAAASSAEHARQNGTRERRRSSMNGDTSPVSRAEGTPSSRARTLTPTSPTEVSPLSSMGAALMHKMEHHLADERRDVAALVKQLRAANAEVEQGEALLEAKQDAIAERTAQLMETKARARRLREQLEAEEDAHGRESWAALQAQPDL